MLRRFANTFLHQIARPAEIDRGGNVRGNVDGDATEPDEKTGETDGNNYALDGWVTLAAVDATVYRLCRDVSLRTGTTEGQPGSVQKYLGPSIHAALLANKRYAEDIPVIRASDILWYNSSTGETQVWYMNGHRLVGRGTVARLRVAMSFPSGRHSASWESGDMDGEWEGRYRLVQQFYRAKPKSGI